LEFVKLSTLLELIPQIFIRVGAAHPGESFVQVTASQVFLDHFVHNRPEEPVLLLPMLIIVAL